MIKGLFVGVDGLGNVSIGLVFSMLMSFLVVVLLYMNFCFRLLMFVNLFCLILLFSIVVIYNKYNFGLVEYFDDRMWKFCK